MKSGNLSIEFVVNPMIISDLKKMGSEQSQQARAAAEAQNRSNNPSRLQRGHTIAITGRRLSSPNDEAAPPLSESRPVSPPISICSDSDLPYVSYTDKLGGEFMQVFYYNLLMHLPVSLC